MLETVSDPYKLNIKRLVLEEPATRGFRTFDAEADISDEQRKWVIGSLNSLRENLAEETAWESFVNLAADAKILFPKREPQLSLDSETWVALQPGLRVYRETLSSSLRSPLRDLDKKMRILFPKKFGRMKLTNEEWHEERRLLAFFREKSIWSDYVSLAENIKVAFPERASKLDLGEEVWQGCRDSWKSRSEDPIDLVLIRRIASLKILFPEREADLDLDERFWGMARTALQILAQQNDDPSFIEYASLMKILTAKEVLITDKGLELVMTGKDLKFNTSPIPLPAVRRF